MGARAPRVRGANGPAPILIVFFFGFWKKVCERHACMQNYFLPKQGSDYVTATEFDSAPMFIFIDPNINRMKFFL